ncbi:hypothetical protein ES705_49661 [subsurface metagenome]
MALCNTHLFSSLFLLLSVLTSYLLHFAARVARATGNIAFAILLFSCPASLLRKARHKPLNWMRIARTCNSRGVSLSLKRYLPCSGNATRAKSSLHHIQTRNSCISIVCFPPASCQDCKEKKELLASHNPLHRKSSSIPQKGPPQCLFPPSLCPARLFYQILIEKSHASHLLQTSNHH